VKLRKVLKRENISEEFFSDASSVMCQFSSVGSLTDNWVQGEFGGTCNKGKKQRTSLKNEGEEEEGQQKGKAKGEKGAGIGTSQMKLIWPTVDFVRNSVDGYPAGGSLCFSNKNRKPFLDPLFYLYSPMQEGRGRVPPHIKSYTRNVGTQLAW